MGKGQNTKKKELISLREWPTKNKLSITSNKENVNFFKI